MILIFIVVSEVPITSSIIALTTTSASIVTRTVTESLPPTIPQVDQSNQSVLVSAAVAISAAFAMSAVVVASLLIVIVAFYCARKNRSHPAECKVTEGDAAHSANEDLRGAGSIRVVLAEEVPGDEDYIKMASETSSGDFCHV